MDFFELNTPCNMCLEIDEAIPTTLQFWAWPKISKLLKKRMDNLFIHGSGKKLNWGQNEKSD